jgi:cob(I)alamin adenosyltransferase
MKIYTRRGDAGETGLFGAGRVSKDSTRVEAYGAVDELNSVLGECVVRLIEAGEDELTEGIRRIQSDLFNLGAHLAAAPRETQREDTRLPALPQERVAEFEAEIDNAENELAPLRDFILPGGSAAAAALHVARTVCRRAERRVVTLADAEATDPLHLVYLNRLSDLLFTWARLTNRRAEIPDVLWTPGPG